MRTRTPLVTAIAALALAGCGTAASTSAPRPPPSQAATSAPASPPAIANPVTILRETGVPIPAGTVLGLVDIYGDRYASANWPFRGYADGGESITVYTYADQAAMDSAPVIPPQDGATQITGRLFTMSVYAIPGADFADGVDVYTVSPATIAARVHGTIEPTS